MRRKIFVLLLSITILACLAVGTLFGCTVPRKGEVEKPTSVTLSENHRPYLRVLQLTDLHLTKGKSYRQDKETLRWVRQAIGFARPDIVAVTGDTVGGLNGRDTALIQLAEIFEETGTYWMYTFGNHDGEWSSETGEQCGKTGGTEGREELYQILKAYPHSLMLHGDTDGVGNYVVDVKDSAGNIVYSFINMDSHGKYYNADGNDMGYLGFTANQVAWYGAQMDALKDRAGGTLPQSALFTHVPLYEFNDAYNTLPHIGGFPEQNLESKCYAPYENIGMYQKIKEIGSTNLVAVGHDHDFNWLRQYEETLFLYGRCSGVNAWERRTAIGATVIEINLNADKEEAKTQPMNSLYKISNIYPTFEYSDYAGWDY